MVFITGLRNLRNSLLRRYFDLVNTESKTFLVTEYCFLKMTGFFLSI